IRRLLDRWKMAASDNFQRHRPGELGKVELGELGKAREIHDAEDDLVFIAAQEGEDLPVLWIKKLDRAARKRFEILSHRDDASHPPKQGRQIFLLSFNVDRFVVIFGIDDDREMKLLRIGLG